MAASPARSLAALLELVEHLGEMHQAAADAVELVRRSLRQCEDGQNATERGVGLEARVADDRAETALQDLKERSAQRGG